MKVLTKNFILLITLSILASCVGTVADKNAQTAANQSTGDSSKVASFDGITSVIPIAHDKVELYFRPAEGDPTSLVYEIYINNAPLPIKVTGNSLVLNASGLYVFTVTNLNINSIYTFNMRAVVAGSNEVLKLDPSKSLSAQTLKNETADFLGISSVVLGTGESGRDTVKVKWVPATIKGTNINPRNTDPVAYEIIYVTKTVGARNINNAGYTGLGKSTITIPYPISNPPALNRDTDYTITGLTPGETYYFQVRAIHKGYITYGSDPAYQREQNTRFLKVTTLNNAGLFDFNDALVSIQSPLGEPGLTNLNISWIPAGGEFKQYRLCYKKVANPNDGEPIADFLLDSDIDTLLSNTSVCIPLDSNYTSYTLPSLTSYAYYQAKVIACRTYDCDSSNRIKSTLMQKRVMANIAPFNGVLTVTNPTDETKLSEVKINFDAPVVSAGFLNKFTLYCYNSNSDTSPVALPTDGSVSSGTGKSSCDGIQLLTPMPTNLSDYGLLNQLTIQLPVIDGTARYCFSLLPAIQSAYLNQEDLSTAVIKCFTPEIKTPTIVQFPGRSNSCVLSGKDLSISWPLPNGGLYTKFVILYREKKTSSTFFNFADAATAFANNNNTTYKWVANLSRDTLNHTLTSLIQGRTYNIGVLPYLEIGADKKFAQYNVNIGECTLPLPIPSFEEWVDIFAIGPKEDGLTPVTYTGVRKYILETLDDDGIPADIKITASDAKIPDASDPLTAQKLSSVNFDGVYGSMDAKDTNPLYQYSNSGIVKLAWKDVSFYSGTEDLNSFVVNPIYETAGATKNQRNFGYRVYRSDDNQMTWLDLTKNSAQNKFQTLLNSGLVHAVDYSWRKRNNESSTTQKIAFFTDYSVKFSEGVDEVDRARIYYYKIIPVFDGKELDYGSAGNSSHHIIKVTLPPRNMALVHRKMANRTICLEMEKDINKSAGAHYSCQFNGLGASGLSTPWAQGNTVYDLGGDLLIDRFELSCPFTRGDQNYSISDSISALAKPVFKGLSTYNNPFKGCYNNNATSGYEPSTGAAVVTTNYLFKQTIPGDCFGTDNKSVASTAICANPAFPNTRNFIYPGSAGDDLAANCQSSQFLGTNYYNLDDPTSGINTNDFSFPTQSEFAAVYYNRIAWQNTSEWDLNTGSLPGGSGKSITQNQRFHNGNCSVNLNWVNGSNEYRPRWIPVNALFERIKTTSTPDGLNLYNKTIAEVLSNTDLYDTSTVKRPTPDLVVSNRYKSTSTLARVVTSNSAKLPPLEGLAPSDGNALCSTYKVRVGLETASKGFVPVNNKIYSKRLMRKKESTIASAWPQTYDQTKINAIESGSYTESAIGKACNSLAKPLPTGTSRFRKADYITTNFPHADEGHPLLMSGSSSRDYNGNNANTEKCVSRFGVQDLVGNLQEFNSEQLFCDYNEDKLYLGLGKSIDVSVEIGSSSPVYDENAVTPWVLSTPASGSCSVVEAGGARAGNYVENGFLSSIYDYLGALRPSVVSAQKAYDQDSVLAARNGDGSFLDFGQGNIAPKLTARNSFSTMTEGGIVPPLYAKYFNPVLGIPLLCEKGCAGDASDNALISSDQICANKDCSTLSPVPAMDDFPVNKSHFTNVGTGDFSVRSEYDSNDPNQLGFNYVSGMDIKADYTQNGLLYSTANVVGTTPGLAKRAYFSIGRGSSLKLYTGGTYRTESGRYSLHITGNSAPYERNVSAYSGTRCSVMINQDE